MKGADLTDPPLLIAARAMLSAGLCVVPATPKKHPKVSADPAHDKWTRYQTALPFAEELDDWFSNVLFTPHGLGLVCGAISGGLEVLDLDAKHDPTGTLNARAEAAIRHFAPGLWEKLVIESTPSGGLHLYYRCATPGHNLKLARIPNAAGKLMAVAETRGEGGFIVSAPTPGYAIIQGDLSAPPTINDLVRDALFTAAISLDRSPPEESGPEPSRQNSHARTDFPTDGLRPGDAYNASDAWMELVKSIGWTTRDCHHWTRPDKALSEGNSANWDTMSGHMARRFHCYTPNAAPLEEGETYSPFRLYAVLKCGGDNSRAARELAEMGFGSPRTSRQPIPQPAAVADVQSNGSNGVHHPETQDEQMARLTAAHQARVISESPLAPPTTPQTLSAEEKKNADINALRALCYARAFNFAIIPPKPVPRFIINGSSVSTPGNLTNLIGQSKTCKSTYQEAMIAAVIAADIGTSTDCDCLGVTATAPKGLQVLHFDTEQSIYDHDQLIRRAIKRAHAEVCPSWLHSFCLTGFSIPDCRRLVRLLLEDMVALGGTHSAFIDGVADLAVNVNDPEECNPLVAELHESAIKFECSIISNIHENPGQDIGKGRGHLGSQLERKAESNLRLRKSDDIVTVFSEKMRRGSILQKDGPTFSWSNDAQMHLSCASNGDPKANAKREKLVNLMEATFIHAGKSALRYSDFLKALMAVGGFSNDHASTRFTDIKKAGLISQDIVGGWSKVEK